MALSKKIALILLALVAITATLESMPRVLVASIAIPGTASAPLNTGPYGTSSLVKLLGKLGYRVLVVSSLRELDERGLWGNVDVAYILVAPYNNESRGYVAYIPDAVSRHIENGRRIYFILADESPSGYVSWLSEKLQGIICPGIPPASIKGFIPSESLLARIESGASRVEVATGYTAYIDSRALPIDRVMRTHGAYNPGIVSFKPINDTIVSISGWAWPSTNPLPPLLWYPIYYTCHSPRGGVGLLADSTLLINAVLTSNESYVKAATLIISDVIGDPRDDLIVVFDQRMYVDEKIALSAAVRFHPSRVLIEGEKIYSSLEDRVLSLFKGGPLMLSALAMAVALGIWSLLPPWTRGSPRLKKYPRRRVKKPSSKEQHEPLRDYYIELKKWLAENGTSLEGLARGRIGRLRTSTSIEELSSYAKRLRLLYRLRALASIRILHRTRLRSVLRESNELAFKLLVLTGWNPAEWGLNGYLDLDPTLQ